MTEYENAIELKNVTKKNTTALHWTMSASLLQRALSWDLSGRTEQARLLLYVPF
jgi:hypothetical protein